jgi:hypothetical protein
LNSYSFISCLLKKRKKEEKSSPKNSQNLCMDKKTMIKIKIKNAISSSFFSLLTFQKKIQFKKKKVATAQKFKSLSIKFRKNNNIYKSG